MAEQAFRVGIFVVTVFAVDALITRCTDTKTDRLSLQCPRRTVIYQPSIFLGVSNTSTCTHQDGDCKGWTKELLRKSSKCFWQKQCNLHWITQLPVTSSENPRCIGRIPTYVAYDQHKCVKKNRIYSICTFTDDITKAFKGVLRSHDHYPETYTSLKGQMCTVELKPKPRHALRLMVDEAYLGDHDHISVLHHQQNQTVGRLRTNNTKDETIVVDRGYVEISFFVSLNVSSYGKGFIIRFENVKIPVLPTDRTGGYAMVSRRSSRNISPKYEASVFDPIKTESTKITISCPAGHVIHNLDIEAVKSSEKTGELHPRERDCRGRYYSLVPELNRCFWQSSCQLTKVPNQILTSKTSERCLARVPNNLSTRRYDCLPEASVVDICNHEVKYITSTHGLIKSHYNYPWHYPSQRAICRKKIRVNKYGLRVFTETMDLDPATRGDNIKIFLLTRRRRLVKKLVSSQTIDIRFTSGVVEIQFKVSRRSTGGQGFILKFEPILEPRDGVLDSDTDSYPDNKISAVSFTFPRKDCKHGVQNIRAMMLYASGYVKVPLQRRCNHKASKRPSRRRQNKLRNSSKNVNDPLKQLYGRGRYKKGKTDNSRRWKNGGNSNRPDIDSINWAATSDW